MKNLLFSLILVTGALQASDKNAAACPADVKALADIKAAAEACGAVGMRTYHQSESGVSDNPQNLMEALKAPFGGDFYSIKAQNIERLLKEGHRPEKQHVLSAFHSMRWDIVLMLVNAGGPLEALDDVAIRYHGYINNPDIYSALETLVGVARGKNQLFLATRLQRHVEEMQEKHPEVFPVLFAERMFQRSGKPFIEAHFPGDPHA